MPTPNKKRIRLLVEALRSGEYRQAQGQLSKEQPDGSLAHCCLGVACQVALKNGVSLNLESEEGNVSYDGDDSELPFNVNYWYGFDRSNPLIQTDNDTLFTATHVNDELKWDFAAIADCFERMYLTDGE